MFNINGEFVIVFLITLSLIAVIFVTIAIRTQKKTINEEKAELEKNLSLAPTIHENTSQIELVTQIVLPLKYNWCFTVLNTEPPFKPHITSIRHKTNIDSQRATCKTPVVKGEKLKVVLQIFNPIPGIPWVCELIFKAFIPGFGQPILVKEIGNIRI